MADQITYRIPGQPQVTKTGRFRRIQEVIPETGIIISDFKKEHLYCLEREEEDKVFEGIVTPPYVVSEQEYLVGAENMMGAMKAHHVHKAVYSRVKEVSFKTTQKEILFQELCKKYPEAFCYLIESEQLGVWVGATPEILFAHEKKQAFAMALAGTLALDDCGEEVNNWTDKEHLEHKYVADYIEEQLTVSGVSALSRSECYTHRAGQVSHLRTDFSFEILNKHAIDVAYKLHPTPAICGVPTLEAMDLIAAAEHHHRELYTGFVGIFDEDSSRFYVNLRCAKLLKDKAYLYLGGGYTLDSDPQKEWEETELKSLTLINAMKEI